MSSTARKFGVALLGGALCAALSVPAQAGGLKDEEPAVSGLAVSFNVAGTTDYVFRGISQTFEDPALQGGVDLTYGLFYAGAWASGIDFGPGSGAHVEVDLYGGIKKEYRGIEFDLGAIYYAYPSANDAGAELNYWEIKAGASGKVWNDLSVGAKVFYSPEYTGETGTVWTFEGTAAKTLPAIFGQEFTLSGTLGYVDFQDDDGASYLYWNVGVSKEIMEHFTLDVRYWDTDLSRADCLDTSNCDARVVGTLSVSY